METEFWTMAASFIMGLLAFGFANMIHRLHEGSKVPDDMGQWSAEIEAVCIDLVRARLHVAAMERRLNDYIGNVPADFNPAMFSAPAVAKAVEQAAIAKAESVGEHPEPRFQDVADVKDIASNEHTWIAGQLLKRVS